MYKLYITNIFILSSTYSYYLKAQTMKPLNALHSCPPEPSINPRK